MNVFLTLVFWTDLVLQGEATFFTCWGITICMGFMLG